MFVYKSARVCCEFATNFFQIKKKLFSSYLQLLIENLLHLRYVVVKFNSNTTTQRIVIKLLATRRQYAILSCNKVYLGSVCLP